MEFEDACPFCGNRDYMLDHDADGVSWWNRCKVCGATGPAANSAHMAVAKWQERRTAVAREKPQRSAYERRNKHFIN